MQPDLIHTLQAIRQGTTRALDVTQAALQAAHSPAGRPAFLEVFDDAARRRSADPALAALPLGGLPVSVKDLFDIAGQPTPAGSVVLREADPAPADALAVARLRSAGASLVGRTHMTEFAFSGIGTNPHFPALANPCDPDTPRIPGGSSSGAAVSVATGAAFVGLGSDTGGSIRIPAALCGLVGFKNTARLTPTAGALPLSTTLDTVCAITRSVRDAVLAHEVLADRRVVLAGRPVSGLRLAVATTSMLDGLDPTVSAAFERTLGRLRAAGAQVQEVPLAEIQALGPMQAAGSFPAAESYAWHRALLATQGARYDPRVRQRIERGMDMKAWEYLDLVRARQAWIARMQCVLQDWDAVLSPTVPRVAAPLAALAPADGIDAAADAARDAEFFRVNALMLRNPSVVNMLDGCALSLPCHAPGELPVGLMVWQGPLRDDDILDIGLAIESVLQGADRS